MDTFSLPVSLIAKNKNTNQALLNQYSDKDREFICNGKVESKTTVSEEDNFLSRISKPKTTPVSYKDEQYAVVCKMSADAVKLYSEKTVRPAKRKFVEIEGNDAFCSEKKGVSALKSTTTFIRGCIQRVIFPSVAEEPEKNKTGNDESEDHDPDRDDETPASQPYNYSTIRFLFRGFAKVIIDGKLVCGELPCLEPFYEYYLECKPPPAVLYGRKSYYNKYRKNNRSKKVNPFTDGYDIVKVISIRRLPLTPALLRAMLTETKTITNEDECVRAVAGIPDVTKIYGRNSLSEYPWFDELRAKTNYFFGDEFIIIAQFYKEIELIKKIMSLQAKEFTDLVNVICEEPWKLCFVNAHYLTEKIGELDVTGFEACAKHYGVVVPNHIFSAIYAYCTHIKPMMNTQGHTFFHLQELFSQANISSESLEWLITNQVLIRSTRKFGFKEFYKLNLFTNISDQLRDLTQRYDELPPNEYKYYPWEILSHRLYICRSLQSSFERFKTLQRVIQRWRTMLHNNYGSDNFDEEDNEFMIDLLEEMANDLDHDEEEQEDEEIKELKKEKSPYRIDLYYKWKLKQKQQAREGGPELHKHQKRAVTMSFTSPLVILTGGPGTGKTETITQIIKSHAPRTYAVLAPTGMAANRLREKTGFGRTIDIILTECQNPNSKTIAWLQSKQGIIIDEVSMLTEDKFYRLASIVNCPQWILVGDPEQIAPIGRGFMLKDLIYCYQEQKAFVALTKNFRVSESSRQILGMLKNVKQKSAIQEFSHYLNSDNSVVLLHRNDDLKLQGKDPSWEALKRVLDHYSIEDHAKIQVLTHRNETCKRLNELYFKNYNTMTEEEQQLINEELQKYEEENKEDVTGKKHKLQDKIFHQGQRIVFIKNNRGKRRKKPKPQSRYTDLISDPVQNGDIDYIGLVFDYKTSYTAPTPEIESRLEFLATQVPTPEILVEKRLLEAGMTHFQVKTHTFSNKDDHTWRRALFLQNTSKIVDIEFVGIQNMQHGMLVTGNKSQANEYKIVVVLVDPYYTVTRSGNANPDDVDTYISKNLCPSLFYVMLSRGMERVIIICDVEYPTQHRQGEIGQILTEHIDPPRNHDLNLMIPEEIPIVH